MSRWNFLCWTLVSGAVLAGGVVNLSAQQGFGALDTAPPTGLTAQQVIDKFAARESVFNKARQNYTFRQTVKVDTISDDTNRPDGEYQQVTDITFANDGRRD